MNNVTNSRTTINITQYVFESHLDYNLLWVATVLSTVGNVLGGGVGLGVREIGDVAAVTGGCVSLGVNNGVGSVIDGGVGFGVG